MKTKTNVKISQERLFNILLAPHTSEKGSRLAQGGRQVIFKVAKDANKHEIKAAVESLFEVKVDAVNVTNTHAKTRNFKQMPGRRKAIKKAYVTLKEGSEINLVGQE
jgi:large subunit ribosomal protein L23